MSEVRLLRLGPLDPIATQAVYHAVAERMDERGEDTIILTRPTSPCLCIGYHQVARDVLDREAARARGIPVLRRRVGGGLTYLDAEQTFYQFVFHHTRAPAVPAKLYGALLRAPVLSLRRLGLDAVLARENEIEVGDRRIAGVGAARIGEASVVVGNVLRDFSFDAMAAVWSVPNDAFRALAAESLAQRITTLRREGVDASLDAVDEALVSALHETLGRPIRAGELRPDERAALEASVRQLGSEAFLDLHADAPRGARPPLKISARAFVHAIDDGAVRGALLASDDRIVRALLESFPAGDRRAAEAALVGRSLREWRDTLRRFAASNDPIQLGETP
jgi:lipoate-protein ligase A